MYRFYKRRVILARDGKEIARQFCGTTIFNGEKENEVVCLEWDNLQENLLSLFNVKCSFEQKRRGKVLFSMVGAFRPLKEWKCKELNASIKFKYLEFFPTLPEAMNLMEAGAFAEYVYQLYGRR